MCHPHDHKMLLCRLLSSTLLLFCTYQQIDSLLDDRPRRGYEFANREVEQQNRTATCLRTKMGGGQWSSIERRMPNKRIDLRNQTVLIMRCWRCDLETWPSPFQGVLLLTKARKWGLRDLYSKLLPKRPKKSCNHFLQTPQSSSWPSGGY